MMAAASQVLDDAANNIGRAVANGVLDGLRASGIAVEGRRRLALLISPLH